MIKLHYLSGYYQLLCEASLRSDMAVRIMHSVIPAIASPVQMAGTRGAVDYFSLNSAANGRHDIIKYGTKACVAELRNYKDKSVQEKANVLLANKDYSGALKLAEQAFADEASWKAKAGYGGKPWEKIAQAIQRLDEADKSLKEILEAKTKAQSTQERDDLWEKEIELKKFIVMQMNIVDGLSHNNSSIMRNMIEQEWIETHPDGKLEDSRKEFERVTNLMDSKELRNHIDVYRQIEDALKEGGNLYMYRDWTWKLRKDPEYYNSKSSVLNELIQIRLRKLVAPYIGRLNNNIDLLKEQVSSLEEKAANAESSLDSNLKREVDIITSAIRGNVAQSALVLREFSGKIDPKDPANEKIMALLKGLEKIKTKFSSQVSSFESAWNNAADAASIRPDHFKRIIHSLKAAIGDANSLVYFLITV